MLTPDSLLAQLRWRYAVKGFDSAKKIAPETWAALESTLQLSPSSYGLQPWKFVVITNPELRTTLKAASWGQAQITDASHLVVFCSRVGMNASDVQKLIDATARIRGVAAETLDGYKNMMLGSVNRNSKEVNDAWCCNQVYIALGMFLAAAATLGVDACPMEGIDGAKYNEILGLKDYAARVVATAGYRSADDKYAAAPKVRYDLRDVVEHRS